jgi:glycosyltransferase involved in cell wall biosynthesis
MHILMLSDVYFPRVNGVSTSIQTFAGAFLAYGHSLTLIAPDYPTTYESAFEVIRIPARTLPLDPEDRLMSLSAIKKLVPELQARTFDIVHIQTPFVAHYAGLFLGKALGLKIVVSYHTYFEAYFEKYLPWVPKMLLRAVARNYSRKQCNQVDSVISPSQQMLARLREYGVTRPADVIPTGLPSEHFALSSCPDFRRRHQVPDDAFLLLYVGRVAHEKNIDFLIDMFGVLKDELPEAILMIVGEGPALGGLLRRVAHLKLEDRVRFAGYLERKFELLACYQSSDVFVFASETETQGLVLLEAMASGLPVVSTASMGSCDVLIDGKGCLVSPPDEAEFARRVLLLRRDKDLAKRLSENGVDYAQGWSADAKARQMLDFYQNVIEGSEC